MNKLLASLSWLFAFGTLFLLATPSTAQNLKIYCEEDKPLQFKAPDGSLAGLTVEVVEEIQKRVGNHDPIRMVPWARGLKYLDEEPNTVLFSMARSAERNDLYHWIGPITEVTTGLYARTDYSFEIKTLDDAKKVRAIGVYRNDLRDQFLTQAGFTNLERTNDNAQNYRKLILGRIDLFALAANEVADKQYTDIKLVLPFLKTQLFIVISKSTDPAIVAKWNGALDEMKKDGTFKAIYHKYYPGRDLPGPAITKY